MKLYRKVKCENRLPEKDGIYHVISEWDKLTKSRWYESSLFENKEWDEIAYKIEFWLEEFEIDEGDIHSITCGKSITLEAGLKAGDDVMEFLKGGTR